MTTPVDSRGYAHGDVLVSTDWVDAAPSGPGRPHRRIQRGHVALSVGPYPGRGPGGLDARPERPGTPRLPLARVVRGPRLTHRHHARHDGRLLRRQEQLVGVLRLLGLSAVRPRAGEGHGRGPPEMGEGRPPDDARRARASGGELPGARTPGRAAPGIPQRGPGALADERPTGGRAQPRRVSRRTHAHARLPERRRPAGRPHPGREEHSVGHGRSTPTTVRSRPRTSFAGSTSRNTRCSPPSPPSRTVESASAAATPGSC